MKMTINLTQEEKKALNGTISKIDLQDGCSEQCLCCSADAPKRKNVMPLETLEEILEWGSQPDDKKDIVFSRPDILIWFKGRPYFHLFDGSDLVKYSYTNNAGKKVGVYDAAKLMNKFFPKTVIALTTPGWKPGSFHEEQLKQVLEDKTIKTNLTYSVKTVGKLIRNDFDNFLRKKGVEEMSVKEFDSLWYDFIKDSKYIARLTSNMKIARKKFISIQYTDIGLLPEHNKKYLPLLDHVTLNNIVYHLKHKLKARENFIDRRIYSGIGRAITELGLEPSDAEKMTIDLKTACSEPYSLKRMYDLKKKLRVFKPYSTIKTDGTISIYFLSLLYNIAGPATPPDVLRYIAGYYQKKGNKEQSRRYSIFADLHGRKIF